MRMIDWPYAERPRERLLKKGASSLSDAELLAIFLRVGVKGINVVDLAKKLLKKYHGLKGVLNLSYCEFIKIKGLGSVKYCQLQAILEIAKRYMGEEVSRIDVLQSPKVLHKYIQTQLHGYDYEVFACLFLDHHYRVIRFDKLFYGTLNRATVYPREVVRSALFHNASSVIFAHNHPSGSLLPSEQDKLLTQNLIEVLSAIEVEVIDHLIVGDRAIYSFAVHGDLYTRSRK